MSEHQGKHLASPAFSIRDVVAAIVTYGDRRSLLLPVLNRLRAEGVGFVVVVDNGAHWPVATELAERFGDWVETVSLGRNTGSAQGFAAALQQASRMRGELIWLLDDDNRPQFGCLERLLHAYDDEASRINPALLAVVAARAEHSTERVSARQLLTRWDSFGGFHVADVISKIGHRLWKPRRMRSMGSQVGVTHFGGMLFHRAVVERFGLPRADFFMYADDTEYTWRITSDGGRIIQVNDALIDDLQPAAQQTARTRNRFSSALLADSGFRSFYAVRNLAFFESRLRCRNRFMFALNRQLYFAILRRYARRLNRMDRYRFIRDSATVGLAGRLGPDPRFPLG